MFVYHENQSIRFLCRCDAGIHRILLKHRKITSVKPEWLEAIARQTLAETVHDVSDVVSSRQENCYFLFDFCTHRLENPRPTRGQEGMDLALIHEKNLF